MLCQMCGKNFTDKDNIEHLKEELCCIDCCPDRYCPFGELVQSGKV